MTDEERNFDDTFDDVNEWLGDEYVEQEPVEEPKEPWFRWWYLIPVIAFPPLLVITFAVFIVALAFIVTAKAS